MVRVLCVVCGNPDPPVERALGDFVAWFRAALPEGVALTPVDARVERPSPSWLSLHDAVIVTGSSCSVYEPHPWLPPLETFLREAVARDVSLLGVCFGHQLLARALGGEVTLNPVGREMGTVALALHEPTSRDPLFLGMPSRLDVQATHRDTVRTPPPGSVVLASSALDGCQAFALGTSWGVQFHPEFTSAALRGYVLARWEALVGEGLDPQAILAGVRDTPWGTRLLENFVRVVRARAAPSRGGGCGPRGA